MKTLISLRHLRGSAFCSVSPARCAGSSFTYAKRRTSQTFAEVFDV